MTAPLQERLYTMEILQLVDENPGILCVSVKEMIGRGSDATISRRLKEMRTEELVVRRDLQRIYPREGYFITDKGKQFMEDYA